MIEIPLKSAFAPPTSGSGTPDAPPEPLRFLVFPGAGAPGPQKHDLKRKGGPKAPFNGYFTILIGND